MSDELPRRRRAGPARNDDATRAAAGAASAGQDSHRRSDATTASRTTLRRTSATVNDLRARLAGVLVLAGGMCAVLVHGLIGQLFTIVLLSGELCSCSSWRSVGVKKGTGLRMRDGDESAQPSASSRCRSRGRGRRAVSGGGGPAPVPANWLLPGRTVQRKESSALRARPCRPVARSRG